MRSSTIRAQESVFKELIFSIPFSFICTHIVLGLQQKGHYFGILLERDYLLIFIPRFLLSYLLIVLVKFITRALNIKYSWDKGLLPRLLLQIIFAILAVSFFDYIVSALTCTFHGIDIGDTDYFETYFLPICIYISLINIFYNYQYLMPQKRNSSELISMPEPEVLDQQPLSKKTVEEITNYVKNHDVVYICIFEGVHFARNTLGETIFWEWTITDSNMALPVDQFYLVTRSLIVHRDIIDTLNPVPKKHSLIIVLKSPFNETVNIAKGKVSLLNRWYYEI